MAWVFFGFGGFTKTPIWVVVNIRVPFWVPIKVRHLYLGYPKRDLNFDNYPYALSWSRALRVLKSGVEGRVVGVCGGLRVWGLRDLGFEVGLRVLRVLNWAFK